MSDSPEFLSAVALHRAYLRRDLSPVEVTRELLSRIERLDPGLACHITVTGERALADARAAEDEIGRGAVRGPLHGVPIGIKDLIDVARVRCTAGSKILAEHVPARDAFVAERLAAAGTVLLGKHNLHEFAYGITNTNAHWGTCRNPWSRERVPGGSSGGSAAALATGMCALAVGTDTGGSIRIPAAACGVAGLKPTLGRVSRRGVFPLAWSLDHVGPMARTVEDAAVLFGVLAGPDPEDPWCSARPSEDFTRDLERGAGGLRVGVPRAWLRGAEGEVEVAFEAALETLRRLGARVSDVEAGSLERAYTAFHCVLATEASTVHERWMRERPADYGELTARALSMGYGIAAVDFVNARREQARVREALATLLGQVDVLLTPALPRTALAIGEPVSREPAEAWQRFLIPFNLAGLPALSIPCGFDSAGLPIGLQVVGRPFDEATVLRVGRAYERETEWHLRRPPLEG